MKIPDPFRIVPTINPNEMGFITVHDQESLTPLRPKDYPIADETLYSKFKLRIPERATKAKWGNYCMWDAKAGSENGQSVIMFFWKKVKTDRERNTQYHFERVTQKIFWDPVLERIEFGQETGFPLSQNTISNQGQQALVTAPRWLVRRWYRPGHTLTTTIEIEHFLSDVPYEEGLIENDEPQPTEVSWDLVGSHGDMGKCLHPEVKVPSQGGGFRLVTDAGQVQSASSDGSKSQLFPATNHKKRRDYRTTQVESVDGQYHMMKMLFKAPRYQKIIFET